MGRVLQFSIPIFFSAMTSFGEHWGSIVQFSFGVTPLNEAIETYSGIQALLDQENALCEAVWRQWSLCATTRLWHKNLNEWIRAANLYPYVRGSGLVCRFHSPIPLGISSTTQRWFGLPCENAFVSLWHNYEHDWQVWTFYSLSPFLYLCVLFYFFLMSKDPHIYDDTIPKKAI